MPLVSELSLDSAETEILARVQGEPFLQLPQDLYIPPDALEVFLETFEGPLDLLLYLIKRQNIDILNIPIADITRQYVEYLDLMQNMRLELAAEYLVMAATLAEIKSRLLLPRPASDDGGEEIDPRAELVRRLQEYERYKQAAEDLNTLPRLERDLFAGSASLLEREVVRKPPPVSLAELLQAIREVMQRAELYTQHQVSREPLSVRERMSRILETANSEGFIPFTDLFEVDEGRLGIIVSFLAILELIRESLLELVQSEPFALIYIRLRT